MINLPFTVETNDILGRYLVAARDLKEGELILKESPLLVGPQITGSIICFKCNCHCDIYDIGTCEQCSAATICSKQCNGNYHLPEECNAIKELKLTKDNFIQNPQIVFPLRCLLIKNYNDDIWKNFMQMETHVDKRRDSPIWRSHKIYVEQIMDKLNILSKEDKDEEIIQKICGILDVNSFELRPPQGIEKPSDCLRGIYLQAALMAHDCTPNAHLSVDDDFVMTVHASTPIKKNETIFYNYGNGLHGNHSRRKHLREGKYFYCICKRCSDPTELGTHLSSIKCPRCKKGLVSPINSLSDVYSASWKCNDCPSKFEGAMIKSTITECKRILNTIGPLKVNDGENVLKKLLRTLSPNHYLILEIKQHLIGMYNELEQNPQYTARKVELCKDFLPILEVVEPGISRLRAIALYELHSAELDMTNKDYNNKKISTQQFLNRLTNCESKLKEALKYLLYEPMKSPEGRLAKKAMTELQVLRNTMKQITRILSMNNANEVAQKLIGK